MKNTLKTLALISTAAVLVACGQSGTDQAYNAPIDHSKMDAHQMDETQMKDGGMDHSTMGQSQMNHSKMGGDTGHTTGKIVSISPDGQEVTIDHNEIEGVGMGAMTMGFTVLSGVKLDGFAPNDNVSFMVKKGRDGSYRITAMCNTDKSGAKCLDVHMDHSGH